MIQPLWKTVVSYKTKHNRTIQSSNYVPQCLPKGVENLGPHRNLRMDTYSSFMHNCQNFDATKKPFRRCLSPFSVTRTEYLRLGHFYRKEVHLGSWFCRLRSLRLGGHIWPASGEGLMLPHNMVRQKGEWTRVKWTNQEGRVESQNSLTPTTIKPIPREQHSFLLMT